MTDQQLIEKALSHGRWRGTAFGALFVALGLVVPLSYLPEDYAMATVTFVPLVGLGVFLIWFAQRASPARNRAARALLREPDLITEASYHTSSSSNGVMIAHWFKISTADAFFSLRVFADNIDALAEALARHCPNARITAPNLTRTP